MSENEERRRLRDIPTAAWIFAGILTAAAVVCFACAPIYYGDADIFYHLSGGEFIAKEKRLPDTSYFSYVSPERPWNDYYWLFQLIVFGIYRVGAFQGLVAARALAFAATIAVIFLFLFSSERHRRRILWFGLVFCIYLVLIVFRDLVLRPHCLSYLFIALFLYVLECRPDRVWLLPILGILWVNIHGVEYPVMVMIVLAYLAESYVRGMRQKGGADTKKARTHRIFLVLTLATVFVSPHALELATVPSKYTDYASEYIGEHARIPLRDFLLFQFSSGRLEMQSLSNLLALFAGAALLKALWLRRARLAHILLLAGGAFLLTKGFRFIYEFSLLALPLIRSNPPVSSREEGSGFPTASYAVLTAAMLVAAVLHTRFVFRSMIEEHGLSPMRFPTSTVAFLEKMNATGRIMNVPNVGGYLGWRLYPRYRIFMDMEVPFLFSDLDFFFIQSAFTNSEVFDRFVSRYNPEFLHVPLSLSDFGVFLGHHSRYRAVCVDGYAVLYVNAEARPDMAEAYGMTEIPRIILEKPALPDLDPSRTRALADELHRLYRLDPRNPYANLLLARLCLHQAEFEQALQYADRFQEIVPESGEGRRLMGESLMRLERYEQAIACFRKALRIERNDKETEAIYRRISICFKRLQRYEDAYRAAGKGIPVFDTATRFQDLYDFGKLAGRTGHIEEAVMLFRMAAIKVPRHDVEWKARIDRMLQQIE